MNRILTALLRRDERTETYYVLEEPDQVTVKNAMRTKQDEIAARLRALEIETDVFTHHIPKE